MTVKQFFKSTAFKCIITLLGILLVCGVFLTVMYGFLEVSKGEKLQRAVSKVYGGTSVTVYGLDSEGNEVEINAANTDPKSFVSKQTDLESSTIIDMYKITFDDKEEFDYLIQVTGKGGYGGGTVTCWVSVKMNAAGNQIIGIGNVTVGSNVGQSFIGKIQESMLGSYGEKYEDGIVYSTADGFVSTGASYSSTAINNAVNGAMKFVKDYVAGGINQ